MRGSTVYVSRLEYIPVKNQEYITILDILQRVEMLSLTG